MDKRGFSLVEVMVAVGIMGAISYALMSIFSNVASSQKSAENFQDFLDIKNEIRVILTKHENCYVSLVKGASPFFKQENDVFGENAQNSSLKKGILSELWLANQAGDSRLTKKFFKDFKINGVEITDLRLVFDNGSGFNYSAQSAHTDTANLYVTTSKKNKGKSINQNFHIPLWVSLSTDSSGNTTLKDCAITEVAEEMFPNKSACIEMGNDGANYGTSLCWNNGGSTITAIKSADGNNTDFGIGTNLASSVHDVGISIESCINVEHDGVNYGTALCWEHNGKKIVAIKTANGNNSDHGIGSNFHFQAHTLPLNQIQGCVNVGYDGVGYGTIMCREKDTSKIVYMKSADGNNTDYGIGATSFKINSKNLGL